MQKSDSGLYLLLYEKYQKKVLIFWNPFAKSRISRNFDNFNKIYNFYKKVNDVAINIHEPHTIDVSSYMISSRLYVFSMKKP